MFDFSMGMFYRALCTRNDSGYSVMPEYGIFVEALAKEFRKIVLVEPTANYKISRSIYPIRKRNVLVYELPFFYKSVDFIRVCPQTAFCIRKIIRQVDFVYLRIPLVSALVIYLEAKRQQKPILVEVVGNVKEAYSRRHGNFYNFGAAIGAHLLEGINQFIVNQSLFTVTQGVELANKHLRPYNRVHPVGNFNLMLKDFNDRQDSCVAKEVRLLWVGNIHSQKGLIYLIKALKIAIDSGLNILLTIVGAYHDESYRKELENEISCHNLKNYVRFAGYIPFGDNLLKFYDNSDIFVYPSLSEGLPRAILEAMARGVPVIATSVGGLKQLISNGENGLVVKVGSPSSIFEGIELLIGNSELRRKLIANGKATARRYSLESYIENFCDLLRKYGKLDV